MDADCEQCLADLAATGVSQAAIADVPPKIVGTKRGNDGGLIITVMATSTPEFSAEGPSACAIEPLSAGGCVYRYKVSAACVRACFGTAGGGACVELGGKADPCAGAEGAPENGSVKLEIGMGTAGRGGGAGYLRIFHEHPDQRFGKPSSLDYFMEPNDVEVIRDANQVIRQVLAPEMLADVITVSDSEFEIRFYYRDTVSGPVSGLYTATGAAFKTWTFDAIAADTLVITKHPDQADPTEYRYEYAATAPGQNWVWTLATTQDTVSHRSEVVEWDLDPNSSTQYGVKTYEAHQDGGLYFKETEVWGRFAWGRSIVSHTVDTGDSADPLTTTRTYYEDGNQPYVGKVRSIEHSNGSWSFSQYDPNTGLVTLDIFGRGDNAIGDPPSAALNDAISYDYTPHTASDDFSTHGFDPRTIVLSQLGVPVSKTMYAFEDATEPRMIVERAVDPSAIFGAATNLRWTVVYTDRTKQRVKSITYPTNLLDSFTYEAGDYNEVVTPPTFTSNVSGAFTRISITHGTVTSPAGVAGQTTRERIIENAASRVVFSETEAYGSGYTPVQWTQYIRDARGQLLETRSSNNVSTSFARDCCYITSRTDFDGTIRDYDYDPLGRVVLETRQGLPATTVGGVSYPAQPAIDVLTDRALDPNGTRVATTTLSGPGGTGPSLSVVERRDIAGRLRSRTDAAGITSLYAYETNATTGGRRAIITRPGEAGAVQQTIEYFRDGRVKSVTGAAITDRYYSYDLDANDLPRTTVHIGVASGPRWQSTVRDGLGRLVRATRPAFVPSGGSANAVTTRYTYRGDGLLATISVSDDSGPLRADTLFEYDADTKALVRTGLDRNGDGFLNDSSREPISETRADFFQFSGDWWARSRSWLFDVDNSATPKLMGTTLVRLTGFDPNTVSETRFIDALQTETSATTIIDPGNQLVQRRLLHPDTTRVSASASRDGRAQWTHARIDDAATIYGYDAIGRLETVTDPRTGALTTTYDTAGRVATRFDAESRTTSYAYYSSTGRLKSVTNALGHDTYLSYNDRGQPERVWGDVPLPVEYDYDATYGHRTALRTFRGGDLSDWNTASWPATPPAADQTSFVVDAATGLLTDRLYADGKAVSIGYTPDGRALTRDWARDNPTLSPGTRLRTTYVYDDGDPNGRLGTGALREVDYADDTNDVRMAYSRAGLLTQVTDAIGARAFGFDAALAPASETFSAGLFAGKRLTIDNIDTVGSVDLSRLTGVQFGTSADPDADYAATYQYDADTARLERVNGPGLTAGGAHYSYLANSSLLERIEFRNASDVMVGSRRFEYEDHRDLLTSISNEWDATSTIVSTYTYQYDDIGRRTSVVRTGAAFGYTGGPGDHLDLWQHNARNELIRSDRHSGTDPTSPGAAVDTLDRDYAYDSIGNRSTIVSGDPCDPCDPGQTIAYVRNELNQYTRALPTPSNTGAQAIEYDADGNITALYAAADINHDGSIDLADFSALLAAFGTYPGHANWNPAADLNGDGVVDLSDNAGLLALFGQPSGAVVLTWDAENRLKTWSPALPQHGEKRVSYKYDYRGRRVEAAIETWDSTLNSGAGGWDATVDRTRWIWADWLPILELDGSNAVKRRYTWGLDLAGQRHGQVGVLGRGAPGLIGAGGIGGLLGVEDGSTGADYLPAYNGRGHVCQLIDASNGALAARYEYDPFGKLTALGGAYADANPFRFSTKIVDAVTGYSYFGYRDYHPHLGRWLTRDPIAEAGGMNLYAYVGNAVADQVDWLGLCGDDPKGSCNGNCGRNNASQTLFDAGFSAEAIDGMTDDELFDAAEKIDPDNYGTNEEFWVRAGGAAQAAVGAAEVIGVIVATGASGGLLGGVAAGLVGVNGIDNLYAGISTAFGDGQTSTNTKYNEAIQNIGGASQGTADTIETWSSVPVALAGLYRFGKALAKGGKDWLARTAKQTTREAQGKPEPCCPPAGSAAGQGASGAGRGRWENVNEGMSDRARAYEQQITGRQGQAYVVDGVRFDGVDGDVLIDAKGPGYSWAVRDGMFRDDISYEGAAKLLNQARRQIEVAGASPIRWHVAETDTAAAIRRLFADNGIGIEVVHTPLGP